MRFSKLFVQTGSVLSEAQSGRPIVTTPLEDQYIRLSSQREERKSLISKSTVRVRRWCSGLRGWASVSKPVSRSGNEAKYSGWLRCSSITQWMAGKKLLFIDESKFKICSSNRQTILQAIKPTLKHGGGNIIVGRCFADSGVGHLHWIDSTRTKAKVALYSSETCNTF